MKVLLKDEEYVDPCILGSQLFTKLTFSSVARYKQCLKKKKTISYGERVQFYFDEQTVGKNCLLRWLQTILRYLTQLSKLRFFAVQCDQPCQGSFKGCVTTSNFEVPWENLLHRYDIAKQKTVFGNFISICPQ